MKQALIFLVIFLFSFSIIEAQTIDSKLKIILQKKDSKKKVAELNTESELLWNEGKYDLSKSYALKAHAIAKKIKDYQGEAMAYNNIGIVYDYLGIYSESLNNYFKAIELQKKINDEAGLAYTYNNIGLIYSNQFNYKKALENYQSALVLRKKNNEKKGISSTYNNIGIVYMNQKEYNKALQNYFASVEMDSMLNNAQGIAASQSNIGQVYLKMKKFDQAYIYFDKALKLRKLRNDPYDMANSYINFGSLFLDQDKYTEAKKYFLNGLEISKKIGAKESTRYTYEKLQHIAEIENDLPLAYEYYKQFILYKDSMLNEANIQQQAQIEVKFKYDQEKAEEKLKQEKQKIQDNQDKQEQQYILWTLIIVIVFILIFVWFLNKNRKIEKAQKNVIEEKNKEILDSITYAKRIQTAILPTEKLVKEYLSNSFILYKPKDIVAGDFYWIEPLNNEIIFAVADCTVHGVPGAMVSVVCHNALNRSVREFSLKNPGDILNKTREIIIHEFQKSDENVKDGMDISLCHLDLTTKLLKWSGANSPLWILKSDSNEIEEIKPSKQPIGQFENSVPFETSSHQLKKEDTIYLFSDGFADQFGGDNGKKMMSKRMKEVILSFQSETLIKQRQLLDDFFENWKGKLDQLDDVCVIGIRV